MLDPRDARPAHGNYASIALEAYAKPDSVPEAYQQYTWPPGGNVTRSGRCRVIIYWTLRAKLSP